MSVAISSANKMEWPSVTFRLVFQNPFTYKPEPNMLKILPIIPSSTSQKNYQLFLFYSQFITYYSHIILLH